MMPYAEAGVWTLDGEGNGAGMISVRVNGEPIASADAFSATVEVASECHYVATDEMGLSVDLFTAPSGDMIAYIGPGF